LKSSLEPYAWLHSSRLKTTLNDYAGARDDLKMLVEQYPDSEVADRARLYLADALIKGGLHDEASQLYSKVYYLDTRPQSRAAAALGVAKCFQEKKDYELTVKWLNRYLDLAKNDTSQNLYYAYFILGKTYMAVGKPKDACYAFRSALQGQLSKEDYITTILALVKGYTEDEKFIEVLDVLENVDYQQLSEEEAVDILLLKSQTLRAIGLFKKAVEGLSDRVEYVSDAPLKGKLYLELAKCYMATDDWESAVKKLTDALVSIQPGLLANEVKCELADAFLRLGQSDRTISMCLQLLNSDPSPQISEKTLKILATAYTQQGNYYKAAAVLLGHWNEDKK
jgi:tetratricopeptide (TPR) repeat protein